MARIYTVTDGHVIHVSHYGQASSQIGCAVPDHIGRELASRSDLRVEFDAPQKSKKQESTEAVAVEPTAKPEEKRAK